MPEAFGGLATPAAASLRPPGTSIGAAGCFIKDVVLFVAVVSLGAVANGVFDVYFSYQEQKAALFRIQQEKAASRRGASSSSSTRSRASSAGRRCAMGGRAPLDQRRFDYVRLLRQVPAITELLELDSGKEQLKVSRLAMDVVGSETDYSKEPTFTEATAHRSGSARSISARNPSRI